MNMLGTCGRKGEKLQVVEGIWDTPIQNDILEGFGEFTNRQNNLQYILVHTQSFIQDREQSYFYKIENRQGEDSELDEIIFWRC